MINYIITKSIHIHFNLRLNLNLLLVKLIFNKSIKSYIPEV